VNDEVIHRRLDVQDWKCAYCDEEIKQGEDICRCFDGLNIAHTACHSMGLAPIRRLVKPGHRPSR